MVWPAIILQKSLIAKLKGLNIKEIISTGTNKKESITLVPPGKNKEKNSKPCKRILITFKPIKTIQLKDNVTIKWLVIV